MARQKRTAEVLGSVAAAGLLLACLTSVSGSGAETAPATTVSQPAASVAAPATGTTAAAAAEHPTGTALPDLVVTATRTWRDPQSLPNSVAVVDRPQVEQELHPASLPQALARQPGVMLQKTANGQCSPYIRGFTGFRNLLLVDGFRFNNSVFRDGPNQYWTLVDPYALDRVEVVRGPGSVMYGSDAVGGVVNAISAPTGLRLAPDDWEGHIHTHASSAEHALVGRAEVDGNLAGKLGYHLGGTAKDMGDIRGGHEVGRQEQTGYDEWNGDAKVEYLLAPDHKLSLSHLHTRQDDVWRTHRTNDGIDWQNLTRGDDRELSHDQEYGITALQYEGTDLGGTVDAVRAGLAWQTMTEVEYRVKKDRTQQRQGFDVNTVGGYLTLESPTPVGRLTYGGDVYHDAVDTCKRSYDAAGDFTGRSIQGPVADDSEYVTSGLFVQGEIPVGERLDIQVGTRWNYAQADAGRVEDPQTKLATSYEDDGEAFTSHGRALLRLDQASRWRVYAGAGQSFRAPGLCDMTRFDIARSGEVEVPTPGLEPETYTTYDAGLMYDDDTVSGELAVFHTDIRDMIVRAPTGATLGGKRVVEKRNAGSGEVEGIELGGSWRATSEVKLFGNITYVDGWVEGYPTVAARTEEEYLSRLMPLTVNVGVRYEPQVLSGKLFAQIDSTYAADADHLSSGDQADTQRIPPGGTPGYTVVSVRCGYDITPSVNVNAACENVADTDYRIHGSGVNEPGRNFVLGLDWRF